MKSILSKIFFFIILINSSHVYTQEWVNLNSYIKETHKLELLDGCWLKNDRKKQTLAWKQANKYNLTLNEGYKKYKTISQIRDFYLWFDQERKQQGHEIQWIGIAAIAAGELSKFEIGFIRIFIIRNKEVVRFAHEGSEKVFLFTFPELSKVFFSKELIRGEKAENWDKKHSENEQCMILNPLYADLSKKAFNKLERMAKGEGIYNLAIPKNLKFEGQLNDCEARINYGITKLLPVYLNK